MNERREPPLSTGRTPTPSGRPDSPACSSQIRPAATLILATVAFFASCTPSEPPPPETPLAALFSDGVRIVDLTWAHGADTPWWPGPDVSPFRHDTLRAHPDGAPAMAAFSTPEHFGTHLDAPVHSAQGQIPVDRIEPAELFGAAVVVDVTTAVASDPDYAVTVDDLLGWEVRHGRIPDGAVVLARTGWAERWPDRAAYYPQDADGTLHFPGFSAEAARWLVGERRIAGIGIDSGSVDPGAAEGFPVHGLVNGSGAFHLENVADMSALPERGAYLVVAPIKIAGGSGGPVRIFAVVPTE